MVADTEFIEQLRRNLPRLLREHPEVRHELWGIMLEVFPSRQEFMELLQELRAFREDTNQRFQELREDTNQRFQELREDTNQRFQELREDMDRRFEAVDRRFEAVDRRFEAVDRHFEAVDRRFEAVIEELRLHSQQLSDMQREFREMRVGLSSLGIRVGYGLEEAIRGVVEEFAGESFPFAERLVLRDDSGEVYGIAGADVEFDLYAHNGRAYLVEVKSHLKSGDVLIFDRKIKFAERRLARQVTPLVIALSMEPRAEQQMRDLRINYRVRAVMS